MFPPLHELPEFVRAVIAAGSALAWLLPAWSHYGLSKGERTGLATVSGMVAFSMWPLNASYCVYSGWYFGAALVLLAAFGCLYFLGATIGRHFGHTQQRRSEDGLTSHSILGGPKLTPQAAELQRSHPRLTTQELFERLDYDPLRMWERRSRTTLLIAHRAVIVISSICLVLGMVSLLASGMLRWETHRSHAALTLMEPNDRTLLEGRSTDITYTIWECRSDIRWEIEGLAAEKARGALGEISATGTYSAPGRIMNPIDLYVVATPVQHPQERKKVKIQLRPHPGYSAVVDITGVDSTGREARFAVEVVDQRYSWRLGEFMLEGPDGPTLIGRMRDDGLFTGFDDIIAVGAASREHRSREEEERRALQRARLLGRWIRDATPGSTTRIHALSVGRYDADPRLASVMETARERRVVVVGVLAGAHPDTHLLEALRDAFRRQGGEEPLLAMFLEHYPREKWTLEAIPR